MTSLPAKSSPAPRARGGDAIRAVLACLYLTAGGAIAAHAQQAADVEPDVPLYGNLGPHARNVTTGSEMAQAYFNEGLQFMFAFGTGTARRSFVEAQRRDPTCAMCFWGEAWGWSPYLNGGMSPASEERAYAAIQRAKALANNATPVERALIDAFAVRFAERPTREQRRPLDTLYMRAMADVAARFPDDLDVATLYAESRMLLRPRRGSVDLNDPAVREILPILEGILARDIRHPGACHLYIHLVEASPEPGRAEACADHLGDAIPGASHIRHMPSHIYMNIGRYGDAVRSNQNAWHVDQQASFGGPPGIYPSHNLHMLLFAATLDGQSAVAFQAAKDLAKVSQASAFYYPVVLAAFGRWDEILELTDAPDDRFHAGMWSFARGMAHLRTGATMAARVDLERIRDLIERIPEGRTFRRHPQTALLEIPAGILEGELLAADGRIDEAVSMLREAVTVEDALEYDEPEPWHLPVRHVLGAIQLEAGRVAEAEQTYRDALEDHPNNGWALFGLAQALEARGRAGEAANARSDFARHWARRDVWLRSSRF